MKKAVLDPKGRGANCYPKLKKEKKKLFYTRKEGHHKAKEDLSDHKEAAGSHPEKKLFGTREEIRTVTTRRRKLFHVKEKPLTLSARQKKKKKKKKKKKREEEKN